MRALSAPSPASAPTAARTASRPASAARPSRSRSASAIGAKVAPPAASQRARSTWRALADAQRDLFEQPRLAEPGRAEQHGQARARRRDCADSYTASSRRSSSSRPTKATAGAPAGRSSETTRHAATGSARPFSAKVPKGASVTCSPTRRRVASPSSTSPSRACACRCAATLTGSPMISLSSLRDDLAAC